MVFPIFVGSERPKKTTSSTPGILLGHWELAARMGGALLERLEGGAILTYDVFSNVIYIYALYMIYVCNIMSMYMYLVRMY